MAAHLELFLMHVMKKLTENSKKKCFTFDISFDDDEHVFVSKSWYLAPFCIIHLLLLLIKHFSIIGDSGPGITCFGALHTSVTFV